MDVTFSDPVDFRKLASKFRAASNGALVRKALTAAIQEELKPVVDDIKTAARGMHIRGERRSGYRSRRVATAGRGSVRRAQFDANVEAKRVGKAMAAGRKVRARRGKATPTGLRERVAHSVKSRVQYTGMRIGAKVYIDTTGWPGSQRKLPRNLNRSGGWRHPVWGHRDRWVAQYGEPYFDHTIARHFDRVRRRVNDHVDKAVRSLR